jgi:hypothetical protein
MRAIAARPARSSGESPVKSWQQRSVPTRPVIRASLVREVMGIPEG